MKTTPTFMVFLIIVIEGYIVLSSELLAIRQTVPFVGSGTDTVSIIIAAVLMPLAFGYYMGGLYRSTHSQVLARNSIRKKLTRNLAISSIFLLLGLSTLPVLVFFLTLLSAEIYHRLLMVSLYAAIFLVTPVYLLGQTVPLVSNYFSREALSKITGKMLFFSTVGSFMGATFSTLVLMTFLGVNYTVIFNFLLLCSLILILSKNNKERLITVLGLAAICVAINSGAVMSTLKIVSNNQYNTIMVYEDKEGMRHFVQNNSDSSGIDKNGKRHAYIEEAEKHFLIPLQNPALPPKDILVIGAGGFTFGLNDTKNSFTYVDIDPSLEKVATKYFLKQPLTPNKKFVPYAIQGYFNTTDSSYDLILLDVYNGDITLPEDLVTIEFFTSIKKHLKPGGILLINFIVSPTFVDRMSPHLENTLRAVFPHVSRQMIGDFDGWNQDPNVRNNALYFYRNPPDGNDRTDTIYTQDKNPIFFDKPQERR